MILSMRYLCVGVDRALAALDDFLQIGLRNGPLDQHVIRNLLVLAPLLKLLDDQIFIEVHRAGVFELAEVVASKKLASNFHDLGKADVLHLGHGGKIGRGRLASGRRQYNGLFGQWVFGLPAREGAAGGRTLALLAIQPLAPPDGFTTPRRRPLALLSYQPLPPLPPL